MKDELIVKLNSKEHPYKDEESSQYELWGEINLSIGKIILINYQWDILEFISWFFQVKPSLSISIPEVKSSCIAELRDILYKEVDFNTSDEYLEKLESYFSNHVLILRGTRLPIYYLGVNQKYVGEISFKNDSGEYFSYNFDMLEFIKKTEEEIYSFLKECREKLFNTNIRKRILNIEDELNIKLGS